MRKTIDCFRFALFMLGWLALVLCGTPAAEAQDDSEFLSQAIPLAHSVQRATLVPSSVILGQAILESGWGLKPVAQANNYFGMKAFERPDGSVNFGPIAMGWIWAQTSEWDGTQYVSARERFRTYRSMADSFRDLGHLYTENARYAAAMQQTADPRRFAREVARAGFATAPDYADKLIRLMDGQNLYQYDLRTDEAEFVDQSDYPTVRAGASFQIYFEVRNAGVNGWRGGEGYSLRNVRGPTFGAPSAHEMQYDVMPEDTVRWTLPLVAPPEPGRYRTEWRLYHGEQPFGPEMYMDVTVEAVPQVPNGAPPTVGLLVGAVILAVLARYLFLVRARGKAASTE